MVTLDQFLTCRDLVESERLLERLVWEESAPIVERIVTSKIRGAVGEDVRSDVLADLIVRLRELKESGGRSGIRDFRAYSAVAAYHGCDKYYRRSFPQRYRLETQLRYLLAKHVRLALWVAPNGKWICGNKAGRRRQPAVTERRRVAIWASSREAARLVEGILDEYNAPLPFDDLVERVAKHWRITDKAAPPSEDLAEPALSVETELAQRGRLRQLWNKIIALPAAQRASLLLNMRDESGNAALPLLPATGVATQMQIASVLEISLGELRELWNGLPLDDLRIASRLGLNRQQVIVLRRSARRRLIRLS
jgi:hypothetical protein